MTTPPLWLDTAGVAEFLNIGVATVKRWDAAGLMPAPRRIGDVTRWSVAELREWDAAGAPPRSQWERTSAARADRVSA